MFQEILASRSLGLNKDEVAQPICGCFREGGTLLRRQSAREIATLPSQIVCCLRSLYTHLPAGKHDPIPADFRTGEQPMETVIAKLLQD
ncbi:MAG TPA: hypothetical protein VGP86_16125, partial [Xanthobacteraceae bacterium]|nr:hypothetical protein [Xanthobacteraceae bacterium]